MPLKLTNNAVSRLAGALTTSSTTLAVVPGDGAKFPVLAPGDWFPLTLVNIGGSLEIVRCTARSTDLFTITRAQEGTAAIAFSAGDRVELRLTSGAIAGASVLNSENAERAEDADQSDKLKNSVNIKIGSASKGFDGSQGIEYSLSEIGAASEESLQSYLPIAGGSLTGNLNVATQVAEGQVRMGGGGGYVYGNNGSVGLYKDGNRFIRLDLDTGSVTNGAGVWTGSLSGNAASATRLSTASGSAPVYGARAFVNFNGASSNNLIRSSGNVSSITDNGTGRWTINFSNAMPHANYTVVCTIGDGNDSGTGRLFVVCNNPLSASGSYAQKTASSVRIGASSAGSASLNLFDANVAIFC